MESQSYTGIGLDFVFQDLCITEGQGPVQDRSEEHLTSMESPVLVDGRLWKRL